jgi:hypothetical protein
MFFVYFSLMNFDKPIPLEEGDFYEAENGYRVFTEQYHLKRGYCCKSDCKHCPYGYDKNTGRIQ